MMKKSKPPSHWINTMCGFERILVILAIEVLVLNTRVSSAGIPDLPTEVDTTIYNEGTLNPATTKPPKSFPTDVDLAHLTPSRIVDPLPETSPIETQLTEAITQTNSNLLSAIVTTEASTDPASTLENDYSSMLGFGTQSNKKTTHARTQTHARNRHRNRHTKGRDASTTAESRTKKRFHSSTNRNVVETARTNKLLMFDTSTRADNEHQIGFKDPIQPPTSRKGGITSGVTTETNVVSDSQTNRIDLPGVTSRDPVISGKDVTGNRETTDRGSLTIEGTPDGGSLTIEDTTDKGSLTIEGTADRGSLTIEGTADWGSLTIEDTTGGDTPFYIWDQATLGWTRPIHETTSKQTPPVVKETAGLSGRTTFRVDGVTAVDVVGTGEATTGGNRLGIGDTTIVDATIVTGSPVVVTEIVTESMLLVNETVKDTKYDVTKPPVLTTAAPMTTAKQTTVSPYLSPPCIQDNPTITFDTISLCLCEPVEGAAQYIVTGDAVETPGFYLRAGQMSTDMEDDFDMSQDSQEVDKEVEWEYRAEHHNTTIDGEGASPGASLCAHFTNLTAGRQYNFTVQASRSPTLPPESFSQPMLAVTRLIPPTFVPPRTTHRAVSLRWFFERPVYVQYYNITYRWGDQIGFSITNLPGSQLEWDVYGLMPGATYTFRVIVATPWNSAYSEITLTTDPFQPVAFVQQKTATSVNLAWNYDDDTFVEHYTIKYTLERSNQTKVVLLPGPWLVDNSFNITGLISGGVYDIKLIAESGNIAKSSKLRINTELIKPILDFTYTNHTSLGINWGFTQPVFFEYFNFSYVLIPSVRNSSTRGSHINDSRFETILPLWQETFELTNLIPGARYTFQLQAVGDLSSSLTQIVKGTRPETPSGVKILRFDATSIELAWNQTYIDHVEFFRILLRSERTGRTREVRSLGPVKIIKRLSPGDKYKIRLSTLSYGEESKPVILYQRLKLKGPVVVSIYNYTDTTVTIKWNILRQNVVSEWTIWCEGPGCNLEAADTYIYIKSRSTQGHHTFDGLQSGERYQFVVNVWSDLENLEGSVFQTTAPGRPLNLRVIDYSSTTISITWEAPINSSVQEYLITYQGMMEAMTGNNTFFFVRRSLGADIKNLKPGNFYEITVQAVTSGALSIPAQDVQNTRLAQVTGVKSHTATNNSFILEWVSAAGYYDNVRVQCGNCSYTEVSRSVPKTSNRITFTNLKSGALYVVKLITMRNGFLDGYPVAFKASTYPDSPEIIQIKSLGDRHITLTWSGIPCEGCHVDFYYIDKVSDDGEALHNDGTACAPSANGNEKNCTKTFLNLHPGHLYSFTVTAVSNGMRTHKPTLLQQRTKPGIPGEVTFNLIEKRSITVSWLPSEGTVDSYIINFRLGQDKIEYDESREVGYNRRQQMFRHLKPGRPYRISIIASVSGLLSAERTIVVHTHPDIPGRVHNFRIKALSPVEVLSTFSEPREPNGIIEAYHISYYGITNLGKPCPSVLDKKLPGTINKAIIGNLYAGCNYTFSILASTGAGKGRPVTQYVRTPIGAPKATGRQPGVPPSNAINRHSFTVTFDTTFFDEAYGEINSYAILVAESTTINTNAVESKNITTPPILMTWAQTLDYDIIPRYQIDEPYLYQELFEGEKDYARRKRDAVFSRDITIGKEKCSKADITDYCNGPLKAGRTYVYQFRGFSANGYSDTEFSPPIQLPGDQTGLIVGISVVLVVLFIIVLVLAVMVIGRRWKYIPYRGKYMLANTSEPSTGTMTSRGSRNSKIKFTRPVLLSEFCQDYHTMNAHSHYGFSQEYEAIRKVGKKMNCNAAVLPDNVSKNRYTNILPYDKTRVKLSSIDDDEGSDYINANYIPGFNSPREFIACQGPLPGTTDDMWKMIWEHNVTTVVMVTQLVEKGKVKCDQYWPEDHKPVLYGDIQVTMTSSTEMQDWNIREFTLQKAENVKKLRHFNYVSWPDHGVPESSDVLLGFIKSVRQQVPRNGTPTVVHCSAGVGRTGTFICLDRILHHIEEFDYVDIMALVAEMRMHRNYMVQTEQQYGFIHRCVLDILEEKGVAPCQTPSALNGDAAEHSCKV